MLLLKKEAKMTNHISIITLCYVLTLLLKKKGVKMTNYISIITSWVIAHTTLISIIIIAALLAAIVYDYKSAKDKDEKKRKATRYVYVFGAIVAMATAGGIINPLILLFQYLALSYTLSAILTVAIFLAILPAWFSLYTLGSRNMVHFVHNKIDNNNNVNDNFFANIIGYANAFFANATGLVLGGLYLFNLLPASVSSIFILQFIVIMLSFSGGFLAAASLTRNSLITVFGDLSKVLKGENKIQPQAALLSVITGIALSAFNYKGGVAFVLQIASMFNLTFPGLAIIASSLGAICLVLTVFASSALLLNLNEAIVPENNPEAKLSATQENEKMLKISKEFNSSGKTGYAIKFFSLIGSLAGAVMVFDALKNSLPLTGIVSMTTIIYFSAAIAILALLYFLFFIENNNPPEISITVLFSAVAIAPAIMLLFSWTHAFIVAEVIISGFAAKTFFSLYQAGFKTFADWSYQTKHIIQDDQLTPEFEKSSQFKKYNNTPEQDHSAIITDIKDTIGKEYPSPL
jgi:MFS family permease